MMSITCFRVKVIMIKKYWKKYLCNAIFIFLFAVLVLFCIKELIKRPKEKTDGSDDANVEEAVDLAENTDGGSAALENIQEGYLDIEAYAASASGASAQKVKLYARNNECYFFMPAYCDLDDIIIEYDENKYSVFLNKKKLSSGAEIRAYDNAQYDLSVAGEGQESAYTLHIMKSDRLPAIFISTANKTMDYINADKDVKEPGTLVCINSDGSIDCNGSIDAIKARGKSSFYGDVSKKSYQLKFSENKELLSMDSAVTWILQANAYDASRLRNKLIYDMAGQMGLMYAVDSKFADIYFNGEYAGNYLVCEKIEAGAGRVDIPFPNFDNDERSREIWDMAEMVNEDDCRYYSFMEKLDYDTGYLLELQTNVDDDKCYFTACNRMYEIRSPQKVSKAEIDHLVDYISTINTLIDECGDSRNYDELKQYIDVDSFAVKYIMDILANEPDENFRSTYFYIKPYGEGAARLYAGPVWDFDRALGNDIRGTYTNANCFQNGWCEKLYQNTEFKENVKDIFNDRMKILHEDQPDDWWSDNIRNIYRSLELDKARWEYVGSEEEDVGGSYLSVDDEFEYLKYYCEKRYELIDDLINDSASMSTVTFTDAENISRNVYIKRGEKISEDIIESMKEQFECSGWEIKDGLAYNPVRPVFSDIVLYAGYEE